MAYATKGYALVDVAIAKEFDGICASGCVCVGAWTRRQAPHPGWTQANEAPCAGKANSHAPLMVACNARLGYGCVQRAPCTAAN